MDEVGLLVLAVAEGGAVALGGASPGDARGAAPGLALLESLGPREDRLPLAMDRAYSGAAIRQRVQDLGYEPAVPPKKNRIVAWEYDRALYGRRNEVERLFRRLKGYRRVFVRYDKLDLMFLAFVTLALCHELLKIA
ncbi:hypothetical protein BH11ARM2_BH11ARM2_08100 [soil metagenome]